jgi:hypothetical protein
MHPPIDAYIALREGAFYESRAENHLFTPENAGRFRMFGSGCFDVLGICKSQSGRRRRHPASAAYLLRAEGL